MATVKQKIATKKVLNGATITKAMKEAGYSKATAKTTGKLTRSLGWKELTDKFISDDVLAKVHQEGLKATTYYTEGIGRGETQLVEKPDYGVRHKYLESGYKLKGRYSEPEGGSKTLILIVSGQTAKRYDIDPSTSGDSTGSTPI